MKDILDWLQDWFLAQCDGEWEHEHQIKIYTADNPGWIIEIDLSFTSMEDLVFEMDTIENGETDWYAFRIQNKKFIAAGDPGKLLFLLEKFKSMAEGSFLEDSSGNKQPPTQSH